MSGFRNCGVRADLTSKVARAAFRGPNSHNAVLANLPDGCPIRIVKFLLWCDVATAIMVGEGSFGRQKTRLTGSANWIPPAGIHRRR